MAISMLKIRRPLGRLIFNMGIAIPGKTVFLIETAPIWRQNLGQLCPRWLVAWRHQAITWTSVDLSTLRSNGIHPRALSWEDLKMDANKARMKFEFLKSHPDLPGWAVGSLFGVLWRKAHDDVITWEHFPRYRPLGPLYIYIYIWHIIYDI